jgi:hypothetical protein
MIIEIPMTKDKFRHTGGDDYTTRAVWFCALTLRFGLNAATCRDGACPVSARPVSTRPVSTCPVSAMSLRRRGVSRLHVSCLRNVAVETRHATSLQYRGGGFRNRNYKQMK